MLSVLIQDQKTLVRKPTYEWFYIKWLWFYLAYLILPFYCYGSSCASKIKFELNCIQPYLLLLFLPAVVKASDVTNSGVHKNVSKNRFRHFWNLCQEVSFNSFYIISEKKYKENKSENKYLFLMNNNNWREKTQEGSSLTLWFLYMSIRIDMSDTYVCMYA